MTSRRRTYGLKEKEVIGLYVDFSGSELPYELYIPTNSGDRVLNLSSTFSTTSISGKYGTYTCSSTFTDDWSYYDKFDSTLNINLTSDPSYNERLFTIKIPLHEIYVRVRYDDNTYEYPSLYEFKEMYPEAEIDARLGGSNSGSLNGFYWDGEISLISNSNINLYYYMVRDYGSLSSSSLTKYSRVTVDVYLGSLNADWSSYSNMYGNDCIMRIAYNY